MLDFFEALTVRVKTQKRGRFHDLFYNISPPSNFLFYWFYMYSAAIFCFGKIDIFRNACFRI